MTEQGGLQAGTLPHSPYVPYDPEVAFYQGIIRPFLIPMEYTGWRDEQMSWKQTAYIHGNLNPSPTAILRGPGAIDFLRDHLVNTVEEWAIGKGKHGIMCDEQGRVVAHGVILRTGEQEFVNNWISPYLDYAFAKAAGRYEAELENVTGSVFLFQIAGPASFDILSAATGDDLSDIAFMGSRPVRIAGADVRILRMGMGGALSYEIHGGIGDAHAVYQAIVDAGGVFGIRRLGMGAYLMNHTENGFPQSYYHFNYPWNEDAGFVEFLAALGGGTGTAERSNGAALRGSLGDDITKRYRTPVELGWARTINFDHEFVGRAALEAEVASPRRLMRTLVWNPEDILDVHRSQFEPGEHYLPMDTPHHLSRTYGGSVMWADRVLVDSDDVGISSGRCYSYYSREMLSLASIDVAYAQEGTEVVVLWGEPGTRQKRIRATVSRFPYLDLPRNRDVDVAQQPARA